jgi:hypothetical protein
MGQFICKNCALDKECDDCKDEKGERTNVEQCGDFKRKEIEENIRTSDRHQHVLLHLQSMRLHLDPDQPVRGLLQQVEHEMYEIAEHLGFSAKEVNNDKVSHLPPENV